MARKITILYHPTKTFTSLCITFLKQTPLLALIPYFASGNKPFNFIWLYWELFVRSEAICFGSQYLATPLNLR